MTTDAAGRLSAALAGRYRIERELGAGGMATVYLAHDERHDRRVALKVLRPELAAILGAARFLAEIKTTANLQHPHILSLFDSGEADGLVFYVMPYVEGESLRDRLVREKQLPVEEAVRIAREVADALDHAHQHGIVHRDIKPENILVRGGHAMVADFGIALAAARSDGGTRMTETGMSLGTPHYMSPEQAMGEREISAKTDVYALGCVLYEMLLGEPPFTGPTAQAIVAKVMTEEPRPITLHRRSVPPHIEEAILGALEKLPADRWASAREFAAALDGSASAHRRTGVREPQYAGTPVRRYAPWAVATLAVVLAGAGWMNRAPDGPVRRYVVSLPDSQELSGVADYRLAMSPDGGSFVYRGAQNRLWLRRRDELNATPLPGTEGAVNPAFSPDGTRLAFVAGTPRAVRVLTLGSSTVAVLTDSLVDRGGVSWGHDGYIYYDGHLEGDGLARVRETGGAPEVFTVPRSDSGENYHIAPHAMPDGRHVLLTVRQGRGASPWMMAVADVRTGRHTIIGPGFSPVYSRPGHLVYVNESNALMAAPFDAGRGRMTGQPVEVGTAVSVRGNSRADVAVSGDGSLGYIIGASGEALNELVWVDRTGGIRPVSPEWRGEFFRPALSPDDRQLAVALGRANGTDIWVKPLDGGPASRLTFEHSNSSPAWLDARRLLFVENRSGAGGGKLASVPADGSRLPRPWHDTARAGVPSVSADGRWITYSVAGNLFAMSADSPSTRHTLLSTTFNEIGGRLSPDSRWLAYMSDESGTFEVYLRPFPETHVAKRQVSEGGGALPFWSRDGRELFYITPEEEVWSVPVTTAPSLTIGRPRRLFAAGGLTGAGAASSLAWLWPSRDGTRFLSVRRIGARDGRDEIVIVDNLPALLRRRPGGAQ